MKHKAILFTGFLLLLFGLNSSASVNKDTTASSKLHNVTDIFNEDALAPYNLWHQKVWGVDTMLNNIHRFISQYSLGNTGLPDVPIIFSNSTPPLGFSYADDHLSEYIRSDSSIRYYNTRAPYTSFMYVTDPQIHQMLSLYHTQNFGKKLNVAFEFHRTRSEGLYVNQGTNLNNVALTANYISKRYVANANVMYDNMKIQQNGGIAADSDLNNSEFSDRQTVPVYLANANTHMIEQSFHLKQYFFFGYKGGDTLHNNPLFYISHSIRLAGHSNVFSDAETLLDTSFYHNFYLNKNLTYDSLRYQEVSNDVSIGSGRGWNALPKWEIGVKDQWVHFMDFTAWQPTTGTISYTNMINDTIFSNLIAHARIYKTFSKIKSITHGHYTGIFGQGESTDIIQRTNWLFINVEGEEDLSGNYKDNMKAMAEVVAVVDSSRTIGLQGNNSIQSPSFIYQLYDGNNFEWRNNFNKVNTSSVTLLYQDAKWHMSIKLQAAQITNLVYFDTLALPAQDNSPIQVLTASFSKEFSFRHWHLNTTEIYQQIPNTAPLPLPNFVAENSIFYQGFLFDGALLLKTGVDVFYNTAYYGYAYMPVFNQFYIQNQQQIGGYVYLNPFVSFRIKTFRAFVKMENVGSGLIPQTNNYYAYALHYPMTDRVLRFGISWDFWN